MGAGEGNEQHEPVGVKEIAGHPVVGRLNVRSANQLYEVETPRGPGVAKVGANTPDAKAQFHNEARLHHAATKALPPNRKESIPAVIHGSVVPIPDETGAATDRPVLITEKVGTGETLDSEIIQHGGMGVTKAFGLLFPVALAIDDQRKLGIIHQDIKPSNILLDKDGRGRLTDFGAAVTTGYLSETKHIYGTPGYVSPEHARGDIAMDNTNIWGFGAVTFFAITGKKLMDLNSGEAMVQNAKLFYSRDAYEEYIGTRMEGLDLSPEIKNILRKALAFDPGDRYRSCAEFLLDLEHAQEEFQPNPQHVLQRHENSGAAQKAGRERHRLIKALHGPRNRRTSHVARHAAGGAKHRRVNVSS